jgi:hypothetical protein
MITGLVWLNQTTLTDVPGTIEWDERSALVLTLIFEDEVGQAKWSVGRDLFADALRDGQAGEGDVHVFCGMFRLREMTWDVPAFSVTLTSPYGTATLSTQIAPVIQFMSSIYGVVPRGEEEVDVDAFIRELNL